MITNSIRNILIGMGTSGMRGGEGDAHPVAGPVPTVVQLHLKHPLSYGKWRLKFVPSPGGSVTGVTISANDDDGKNVSLTPPVSPVTTDPGFHVEWCGDICTDLRLVRITASVVSTAPGGSMEFEAWGQTAAPGPGSGERH